MRRVGLSPSTIQSVVTQWFDHGATSVASLPSGLSGACLYRVSPIDGAAAGSSEASADVVIKAEPVRTRRERPVNPADALPANAMPADAMPVDVMPADAMIEQASRYCALLTPPRRTRGGQIDVYQEGFRFRCFDFRDGSPLDRFAGREDLGAAAKGLASAHVAMAKVIPAGTIPQKGSSASFRSPTVASRLRRLDSLDRISSVAASTQHLPEPLATSVGQAQLALREVQNRRRVDDIRGLLRQFDRMIEQPQWILRDIHREHVLIDRDCKQVVAILDHDAATVDDPAVDLARFAGGFSINLEITDSFAAGDTSRLGERLATVAAEYRLIRPFSQQQEAFAVQLMLSGWLGSLANWVDWLGFQRRQFAWSASRLSLRIDELVECVRQI
ncbi:MAG: phosphotransferase [Planctomycetota bacterium]